MTIEDPNKSGGDKSLDEKLARMKSGDMTPEEIESTDRLLNDLSEMKGLSNDELEEWYANKFIRDEGSE